MNANNRLGSACTKTATLAALLLAAGLILVPAAGATGWLVNAETGLIDAKYGTNVFGGSGDTVDIGYQNYQCTDEDDVVDVGIQNREGDGSCGYWTNEGCDAEQGRDVLLVSSPVFGIDQRIDIAGPDGTPILQLFPPAEERSAHCSDDGDTIDVGIGNQEGGFGDRAISKECYYIHNDPWQDPEYEPGGSDEADGVDVGIANQECGDDLDAVDVGVLNCEMVDESDGFDVGVLNLEWWDSDDTFDVSVFNMESPDGPDGNGVNILPYAFGFEGCYILG